MSEEDLRWTFWIPFREEFGGQGGIGTTVSSPDGSLETAVRNANERAAEATNLLDYDSSGVGVYFATDEPFGAHNLAEVECSLDSEGVVRLGGESDDDFLKRVNLFFEEHREYDEEEG